MGKMRHGRNVAKGMWHKGKKNAKNAVQNLKDKYAAYKQGQQGGAPQQVEQAEPYDPSSLMGDIDAAANAPWM